MKHNIKIFSLFARLSFKTIFQGRFGAWLFLAGKILRFGFFLVFISVLFGKTKLIKGYSLEQVIIFFLTYNLIDTIAQALFREVYRFRPLVLFGGFDLVLTKPYHPFLRVLLGGIDFLDIFLIVPYAGLIIFFASKIPALHPLSSILYLLFIFNSILIATAFHIAVLALGIMTTNVDHTILIYRDLTSLGRFPIDIYQSPLREIFTYILPVAVIMTFPVKALFGLLNPFFIAWSFLVSLLLCFLSIKLWNYALKRYQSYGG